MAPAGTKDTADGEARDITSFVSGSAARDAANKDVARTESLLQLPSKPVLTKLSMAGGEDAAMFFVGEGWGLSVCGGGRHRHPEGHSCGVHPGERPDCSAGVGRHPEPAFL